LLRSFEIGGIPAVCGNSPLGGISGNSLAEMVVDLSGGLSQR
jgi:hypothetical protein